MKNKKSKNRIEKVLGKSKNSSPGLTQELLVQLLLFQDKIERYVEDLFEALQVDPKMGNPLFSYKLLDLVLDAAGVPPENWDFNSEGILIQDPEEAFSRDWLTQKWYERRSKITEARCREYLRWVEKEMSKLKRNNRHA